MYYLADINVKRTDMNTEQLLQHAIELMNEAIEKIELAKQNESFDDYYGYSADIVIQELVRFSDNRKGYIGRNTTLEEMIEGKWDGKWEEMGD